MAENTMTQVETSAAELAVASFGAFCDDVGGMFGVGMTSAHEATKRCSVKDLQGTFGRLAAVNVVGATGALSGSFRLIFDRKGIFTLAGVIVMLPEERIVQVCKTGDVSDATAMGDAVREAGNLLVGSWDKAFRDGMPEHGHFVRQDVFIGEPWAQAEQNLGFKDGDALCVICNMAVEPYPPFKCAVVFPDSVFAAANKPAEVPAAESQPEPAAASAAGPAVQPAPGPTVQSSVPEQAAVSDAARTVSGASRGIEGIDKIQVKDVMCRDIVWVEEDSTVGQVFERLESGGQAYAMVGKDGHASGIISRSDLYGSISPFLKPVLARWRRPQDDATLDIKVKWIMSKPVRMTGPGTPLGEVAARMIQMRIGSLPVADDSGKIQGIVTRNELLKLMLTNN